MVDKVLLPCTYADLGGGRRMFSTRYLPPPDVVGPLVRRGSHRWFSGRPSSHPAWRPRPLACRVGPAHPWVGRGTRGVGPLVSAGAAASSRVGRRSSGHGSRSFFLWGVLGPFLDRERAEVEGDARRWSRVGHLRDSLTRGRLEPGWAERSALPADVTPGTWPVSVDSPRYPSSRAGVPSGRGAGIAGRRRYCALCLRLGA